MYLNTTTPQPLYGFTLQTVQITTQTPETVVNDQYQQNPLGALIKWNGNVYRYVQHDKGVGSVASAAAGQAMWRYGLAPAASPPVYFVTPDVTDSLGSATGSNAINGVAGIYKGVVTDQYFTFIAVGGIHNATVAAGSTVGDHVIGSTTDLTFGRIASGTAPTSNVYGITQVTTTGTTASVLLQHLIW